MYFVYHTTCDMYVNPLHLLTLSSTGQYDQKHECMKYKGCNGQIFNEYLSQRAKFNNQKSVYTISKTK